MNFLAEVLSSAETMELEEINKKVPELRMTIENIKDEVVQYTENIYVKYSGRPKQNRMLLDKAREIEEEIKTLKKNAENVTKKELSKSSMELEKHVTSLDTINFKLRIVSKVCHINEQLISFTSLLETKDYLTCMKLICQLKSTIMEIPDEEYVEIMDVLKANIKTKKVGLINELTNIFNDNILILNNKNHNTLKIRKNLEKLDQALLAIFYESSVVYPLHNFAKLLWNNFFTPTVDSIVNIVVDNNDIFYLLELTVIDLSKKTTYLEVFSNLKVILEFLKNNFNLKLNDNLTTLEYIGADIRDNLSELIIKHCLEDTVPSTAEDLQKYKTVIEETEKLETDLRNCGIFDESTVSILEYANNIDILFINKKCREHLKTCEDIMKKDLHDMVEVGVPYDIDKSLRSTSEEFHQCSISKNVIELLQFTEKITQQAVLASDVCAGRLFCTVQNIIRKYGNFVPEYHKKLLQAIPQQVALFHNNCFYISYTLTEWNQMYSSKLSTLLSTDRCSFTEEAHQIQQIGSEIFKTYVKGQIKQISEIMNDCGLEGATLENIQPITEKCIRQCLRQQELLKTVWHKVLSYQTYNQTLGVILNSLCLCIINSIVKFEDISSSAAEQLIEIIKIVVNRGPKLFSDSKEVSLYVNSWYKLNEMNFVLGASLLDINDRWADGKGPLALHFKPRELKSLIRALFQNTDRRSAVLARIQE